MVHFLEEDHNQSITIAESEYLALKREISKVFDYHVMLRRAWVMFSGEMTSEEKVELHQQFTHFFREYGH